MELLSALIISTIAGLSTMIGSLVIYFKFKEQNINKFIVFALSFSSAVMIAISITDLIPSSAFILLNNYGVGKGIIYVIGCFLIGVIIIKWLYIKIKKEEFNRSNLYKLGLLNMLALILHNFPEGIATFMSSYKDINLGIKLSIAITLHNIPEGISIAVPIYYATNSKRNALFKTFLSGIAEPIGALIAYLFLSKFITDCLISFILILVGGIMITLAIEVLIPEAKKYNLNWYLNLGLLIGFILSFVNYLAF